MINRLIFLIGAALSLCLAQHSSAATPPVVFVNGYQLTCVISSGFSGSFGAMNQLLSAVGIQSAFYDTCQCRGCIIEEHAKKLAAVIASVKNSDGTPASQVDVVAVSMGGLILRSYLAGKNSTPHSFTPPLDPKVRKAVFIATPNFGVTAPPIDNELMEMQPGSRFLWDLNTWNQGTDDLRGVDALAIVGDGGSASGRAGMDDGLIPLSSGSLSWIADDSRTRILHYCHTNTLPLIVQCRPDAPPIAKIDSSDHPIFRTIFSFLTGTDEWRTIGTQPSASDQLANKGAVFVSLRDSADRQISPAAVTAAGLLNMAAQYRLFSQTDGVFYRDWMLAQPFAFTFQSSPSVQINSVVPPGGTRAMPFKLSPAINRVYPAAAMNPLALAPGMLVSIYGVDLAPGGTATVFCNGQPVQTTYTGNAQINAALPAGISGWNSITVRNSKGEHTIGIMVEPSVPAVFSLDASGTGPAAATDASGEAVISSSAPARSGQVISIYATGLGETQRQGNLDSAVLQPAVTIAGRAARILFAGRSPAYSGLDQINLEVPSGLSADPAAPLIVRSGQRISNVVTLAIQ